MTREFLLYIVFLVLVIVVVSVYLFLRREGYYPYAGPVWGGPWNMPTRDMYYPYPYGGYPYGGYPYGYSNKWGYDVRGPPLTYPPTELPGPKPSENTTDGDDSQSTGESEAGPVTNPVTNPVDIPVNKGNNQDRALAEYERESKWWPGWARWDGGWWGGPFFNYRYLYDTDGKLKRSNNNSIPANHQWSWAW
jgi:hypothetical protein